MKNEYNDKDEELVRDTVNHIIANDVFITNGYTQDISW